MFLSTDKVIFLLLRTGCPPNKSAKSIFIHKILAIKIKMAYSVSMELTLDQAEALIGTLAYASKMPCHTYSFPAKLCHTGSKLQKVPGSVCNKCYALRGNFARSTVINAMEKRLASIDNPLWVPAMVRVLKAYETSGYFRWHASGDVQSLGHLIKICEVARQTPHIRHWLPTHEIGILNAFKNAGFEYPRNLVVRLSAAMIEQKPSKAQMKSLGVLGGAVSKKRWNCPSSTQDNMCQECRQCWLRTKPVITYKYH